MSLFKLGRTEARLSALEAAEKGRKEVVEANKRHQDLLTAMELLCCGMPPDVKEKFLYDFKNWSWAFDFTGGFIALSGLHQWKNPQATE